MPPALLKNSRAIVPVLDGHDRRVAGRQDVDGFVLRGRLATVGNDRTSCSGWTPSTGISRSRSASASASGAVRHGLRRGCGPDDRRRAARRHRRRRPARLDHRRPGIVDAVHPASAADGVAAVTSSSPGREPMTLPNCQTTAATTKAPARKPQPAPAAKVRMVLLRRCCRLVARRYSEKTTRVPGLTRPASLSASQLVRRTQPCDCVRPIVDGSGVPWRP